MVATHLPGFFAARIHEYSEPTRRVEIWYRWGNSGLVWRRFKVLSVFANVWLSNRFLLIFIQSFGWIRDREC